MGCYHLPVVQEAIVGLEAGFAILGPEPGFAILEREAGFAILGREADFAILVEEGRCLVKSWIRERIARTKERIVGGA